MKRQDIIRILVIACVTIAALGILVPAKVPATNPMQGPVTTTITMTSAWTLPGTTFTTAILPFTFSNILTSMTYTSYIETSTATVPVFVYYNVTLSVSTTVFSTVSTRIVTQTRGTTTVPSTSTTVITETGTTTGQTLTTTASQTVTQISTATTGVTSTSRFTVTGATAPNPPPIPGFPLESILAGLGLGLLGAHLIYRKRRTNKKRHT